MMKRLRKDHYQRPGLFSDDPVGSIQRYAWINPFVDGEVDEVVEPLDYFADLQGFKPEVQQKMLHYDTAGLIELAPV